MSVEVRLAKTAGFCFGVKRAVDTVYDEVKNGGTIYTYGPIIHNAHVVSDLEEKGVTVIEDIEDVKNLTEGTIVIRSHGVSRQVEETLRSTGLKIVDATCPFVKKIHRIVEKDSADGRKIIVIGSKNHPEVFAITGWCHGDNEATVIENVSEALDFEVDLDSKITIVSQTTFQLAKFQELVEIFKKKGYDINVVNTICNATADRQQEAKEIAKTVDAMIVIGDSKSSNTQKLYEICSRECKATQYVQTKDDLDFSSMDSVPCVVGITAGASTPNKIIEEVQNYVRINF